MKKGKGIFVGICILLLSLLCAGCGQGAEDFSVLETTGEEITMEYMRILPVYEIIEEEAEYYFNDAKSLEEVVDIINSRVGIYVGEQHGGFILGIVKK